MAGDSLSRRVSFRSWRLMTGTGVFVITLAAVAWWVCGDGIPVLWGPTASAAEIAAGKELFEREWTANDPLASGDGLGPVFNARSCVACHSQGGTGGGGNVSHNVVHFEVLPQPGKNGYITGTLHSGGVTPADRETADLLRAKYPITVLQKSPPPDNNWFMPTQLSTFDPIRTHSVQPAALFGAGWIDRIPTTAITRNADRRLAVGKFSGIPVGRVPRTADGRVGRFGWKGSVATLKEFVASACANELGLGTSITPQAKPLHTTAADVPPDLTEEQFGHLVAFVDTLPRPVQVSKANAERGKELFGKIGCAACHVPDLGGVKGVYSDFLLYKIEDGTGEEAGVNAGVIGYTSKARRPHSGPPIPPENSRPDGAPTTLEWKTPPLWGVADSAPYLHDGSAPTLFDAILRHQGDAKSVTAAYENLSGFDRGAVIAFLESLKAAAHAAEKPKKR